MAAKREKAMGKTRSSLGRYGRKHALRKKKEMLGNVSYDGKRKFEKTPIKSPYKSPLYKGLQSPAYKRQKIKATSTRSLFKLDNAEKIDNHVVNVQCEEENNSNIISSSTDSVEDNLTDEELVNIAIDTDFETLKPNTKKQVSFAENYTTEERDEHNDNNDCILKMLNILPRVMKNLSEHDGLDEVMLNFFEMVAEGTYPLDNIAFLLWTEVVKWHQCSNTSGMRYSRQTKLFWKLGWRIFGKRFVNYMGGFKSHGEVVLNRTNRGNYKPDTSDINFAVPDTNVLRGFDPYDNTGERKPGIYLDIIQTLSENLMERSVCITFDGKKIKQGLTENSGDVDLLGHEKGLSLAQRNDILQQNIIEVQELEDKLNTNVGDDINNEEKSEIIEVLKKVLRKLSIQVNDLLSLREKKEYCKLKLIERSGGSDWRKGRYAFAISSVIAFIYEIDEFMKRVNILTNQICCHIAFLNNSKYIIGDTINLNQEERYISTSVQIEVLGGDSSRTIKQRSEKWHELRSGAKVTGSTLYQGVGCDGLGRQKDHFEKVICGVENKEPSEMVKKAMQHGVDNEDNAVGTFIGKILPVLTPDLIFCEEGCVVVDSEVGKSFMVVSPDGSLRRNVNFDASEVAIEIKCPLKKVHTDFPARYLLQCLSEIQVLNVPYLIYISWTEDGTTIFRVDRNDALLAKALKLAMELYGADKPKKPTKLTQSTKDLKEEIEMESKKVMFIGRFPSCKISNATNIYDDEPKDCDKLCELFQNIVTCYRKSHELQRQRATEAIVFLVADLDRSWKRNAIRCSPVGWFPKGYSLNADTMRGIAEEVHTLCIKGGIHAPCQSFDGQWHLLVVRDKSGNPLTLLQLQKDVWKSVETKSKKEILDLIKQLNKIWTVTVDNNDNKRLIQATNGGITLPKYRHIQARTIEVTSNTQNEDVMNYVTLMDSVPDLVREVANVGEDVMALTNVTDVLELEAFSHNANEEEWSQELEDDTLVSINDTINKSPAKLKDNPGESRICTGSKLNRNDMECILALFKTTKDCNKKLQWDGVTSENFIEYFRSYERMSKLLDIEVRIIVKYLKKTKGMKGVKESSSKKIKLEGIARHLGIEIVNTTTKRTVPKISQIKKVNSLQDLAAKVVSKYSKQELNVAFAEYLFESKYKTWIEPVVNIKINGGTCDWFYKPEYSASREQFEVKCIDSTHLLTRARRKTCSGGIEGLTNEPWMKVAKQRSTLLTPIMIEDISDPMSASMAKTHFSENVEMEMRKNGDNQAADLCRDIRKWWESEDSPGISAADRIEFRKSLRRRLLTKVNFTRFPPPTQYVCGWPIQLWEALLSSIDAKTYLYGMVHSGTYNVRAFSSLIGETFFSELVLNDKRGQGTVSASEFGQYIEHSAEQLQIRLDQDRKFVFCTSKSKVYDTVDESYECEGSHHQEVCRICQGEKDVLPQDIDTRDHVFDIPQRKRLKGRRNREQVPAERNAMERGTLGVRWEKARCNMSKMLPTKRIGILDI